MNIQEVLSRLHGVKGSSPQYSALCPAHDDTRQSLSIREADDGKILLTCFAGCSTENVVTSMGLSMKDLFPEPQNGPASSPKSVVAEYNYTDAAGNLLAQKLRKADKTFSWRRPDGKGGWLYNRKDVPHVLYNLPAIQDAARVFVVEGEKDADTLARFGVVAVSGADGAGHGKWKQDYNGQLQGKNVVILPDNDAVGRRYAGETAKALHDVAASVRVLDLLALDPALPEHGDISDILATKGQDGLTALMQAAEATPEYVPGTATDGKKQKKFITIGAECFDTLNERALTAYLASIGASVRYNVINRVMEIKGIDESYNPETLQNDLPIILHDQLKDQLNKCDKTSIQDLLGVIAGKNRFNPVVEMLESNRWDKIDRVTELFDILHIPDSDTLSRTLIKKWLWQALSMVRNELHGAYGADGVLVLQGPQGIGKTSLVRKLAVRPELCKLGQHLDSKDKDTYRRATSAWLVEFGEIETTFKSDLERLKAFITAEIDEYRLPYGRSDQTLARRTAIIGTCNSEKYLIDPTGSRRFWTVPVTTIDLDRLTRFDSLQLWLQVEEETRHDRQGFRLTREEQARLALRNIEHEKLLPGQAEVMDVLSKDDPDLAYCDVTVTDFKNAHRELSHYSVDQIAKALNKLGIGQKSDNITRNDGTRTTVRLRNLPVPRKVEPLCGVYGGK